MAQIRKFFTEIEVGARQSYGNMTLYCMLAEHEASVNFRTLGNALEKDALSVREFAGGSSVTESTALDKSVEYPLFIDRGELSQFRRFRRSFH